MNWDQRSWRKQLKKHTKRDQKILKKNTRHQKGSKLNFPAFKIQKINREVTITSIRSPTTYFNNANDATSLQLHCITHVMLHNQGMNYITAQP